jgi:nucleoside-diphosphate-sugar epimerase
MQIEKSVSTRMLIDSGSNVVQVLHVNDAAQGFYLALEKNNSWSQTFFISQERRHPYSEVRDILCRIMGRKPPAIRVQNHLAKAFMCPVYLARVAAENWHFMWKPMTVDAVAADRA